MENPIKEFREAEQLTQEQMGELAGVKKSAVSKWEDGVAPSAESAKRIEEATGGRLPKWKLRPDLWEPPAIDQEHGAAL